LHLIYADPVVKLGVAVFSMGVVVSAVDHVAIFPGSSYIVDAAPARTLSSTSASDYSASDITVCTACSLPLR
jgi:hypothetical protein